MTSVRRVLPLTLLFALGACGGGSKPSLAKPSIAFLRTVDGAFTQLHVVPIDGSEEEVAVGESGFHDSSPSWSPDGTRIAFSRFDPVTLEQGLHVLDLDSDTTVQLTDGPDSEPAWSPDGTRIAFLRTVGGAFTQIHVVPSDGSGEAVAIGDAGEYDASPAWSPDGTRIAFRRFHQETLEQGLHVLDLETGATTRLTSDLDAEPTWSPDGSEIAFHRTVQGLYTQLHVVPGDGSADAAPVGDVGYFDSSPSWSPDGRELAFSRVNPFTNVQGITVLDLESGATLPITRDLDDQPAVSPVPVRLRRD